MVQSEEHGEDASNSKQSSRRLIDHSRATRRSRSIGRSTSTRGSRSRPRGSRLCTSRLAASHLSRRRRARGSSRNGCHSTAAAAAAAAGATARHRRAHIRTRQNTTRHFLSGLTSRRQIIRITIHGTGPRALIRRARKIVSWPQWRAHQCVFIRGPVPSRGA